MATITCTPGGSADNCYVTLAESEAYWENTLDEAGWEGFGNDDRERALIGATAEIEALGGAKRRNLSPSRALFDGEPYATASESGGTWTQDQALHFPRTSDYDENGDVYIPQPVHNAVCEQAVWRLQRRAETPLVDRIALQAEGVRSMSVDGLLETYVATKVPPHIAPRAWGLISPLIKRAFRLKA